MGRRLSLWALAQDYGRRVAYSGPLYQECVFQDGKVRLKFAHAGARGGAGRSKSRRFFKVKRVS